MTVVRLLLISGRTRLVEACRHVPVPRPLVIDSGGAAADPDFRAAVADVLTAVAGHCLQAMQAHHRVEVTPH